MNPINTRGLTVLMFACGTAVIAMLFLASLAVAQSDPNRFNRLMKPAAERNAPPPMDGIHDAESEGTYLLQTPLEAFATLPKSKSGNYVQWNEAIDANAIVPRNNLGEQTMPPIVLDLNIVREVKGSMPDVVYPHKQHTQWLDCANCHPDIFNIKKKATENFDMQYNLEGKFCGVCHLRVAFPMDDCSRCHPKMSN